MEYQRIDVRQREASASILILPVALLLLLILLKPTPLYGGFADDFRYLVGAQCLDCLPTNHWERRFAITWPTGIAIQLFGQNTWSVMLAPITAGVTSLVLTFKLVEWHYGRLAALIASVVYAIVFVALSAQTSRALVIGLLYVFVWETLLSNLFGGIAWLSVRQYALGWADALISLADFRPDLPVATAVIASIVVVAAALWLGSRRLAALEIGERA